MAAGAVGHDGGELTAIAYCARNPAPLITEVSASTPLPGGQSATATTPQCPPGLRLAAGGFDFNRSREAFFAAGWINSDDTWSATGFGYLGPAPAVTAYGYCLAVSDAVCPLGGHLSAGWHRFATADQTGRGRT